LVQFLFLLTWVVYVIFLGDMLARLGLPKDWLPKLLLADQIFFLLADIALGYQADRAQRLWGRVAPLLVSLNLLSCLAFVALPFVASPSLFIALTVLWVLTASVLRAPLYGLIGRRSSDPRHGTAAALLGMGVASALSPYLGQVLKGMDPTLPFILSAVSLAIATLGFSTFEKQLAAQAPVPETPTKDNAPPASIPGLPRLLTVALLLGGGFQLHAFLNAAPLYKAVVDPALLPWLMPTFWTAFSLVVWPGAWITQRFGTARALAAAALTGGLAATACLLAPGLPLLLALQALAGAAWAIVFLAGLTLASELGRGGRESLFIAGWFAIMAVAAAARIALGMAAVALPLTLFLAAGMWLSGAVLLLPWLVPARFQARNNNAPRE
jgi:MFS family permease